MEPFGGPLDPKNTSVILYVFSESGMFCPERTVRADY
jgi:hypothetical protein